MKKLLCATIVSTLFLAVNAPAQSKYYVIANDSNASNSATVFNLNPNGSLKPVLTLETGTEAFQGGFYAAETQAISPNATCIFVASGGTGDIAAFSKATGYKKVGNYSDASLQAGDSMPMIENNAGTLLYASYASNSMLAVWSINQDCSLTLANTYTTPPFLGSMAITHDQKTLLVTYEVVKKAGSWLISGDTLTKGVTVATPADVSGIAATNDGQVVIMGTAFDKKHPSNIVTASLPGFTNLQVWPVGPGYSAGSIALSAAAAAGNGCLYIGNNGSSGQSGVTGATFVESPLAVTYVNNVVSPLADSVGTVETVTNAGNGGAVYAAESAGYIGVYSASSTCSVNLVKETQDPNSTFVFSVSSWVQ
jgi:hypothetical protein